MANFKINGIDVYGFGTGMNL